MRCSHAYNCCVSIWTCNDKTKLKNFQIPCYSIIAKLVSTPITVNTSSSTSTPIKPSSTIYSPNQ